MKKEYIIPTMTVANVELANMIAASNDNPQGFSGGLGTTNTDGSAGLSRQSFNVWGDEDEE